MKNQGFAISGIFYFILVIFLCLMILLLYNLQSKKTLLDKLRTETLEEIECNSNYEYLKKQIDDLKAELEQLKQNTNG